MYLSNWSSTTWYHKISWRKLRFCWIYSFDLSENDSYARKKHLTRNESGGYVILHQTMNKVKCIESYYTPFAWKFVRALLYFHCGVPRCWYLIYKLFLRAFHITPTMNKVKCIPRVSILLRNTRTNQLCSFHITRKDIKLEWLAMSSLQYH